MGALEHIQEKLQNTNALIVQVENALKVPENEKQHGSLSANLRSLHKFRERLEAEFLELASLQEQEVYRYRIIETTERPSLGGVAEAWANFQKLFSVVYTKLTKEELPAPLGYGYCFTGSVGVVVTLPRLPLRQGSLLNGSPIDDTSEIVFDLIESKRVPQIAKELGPEPVAAMNEWLSVHIEHHFGIGLEWRSHRTTKRQAEVMVPQLASLQTVIAEASTEVTVIIDGELYAVDTDLKTFKFRGDDGTDVEGAFESAITQEHAASVPARYRATIAKTTRMLPSKKQKAETYFLRSLEQLWASKA